MQLMRSIYLNCLKSNKEEQWVTIIFSLFLRQDSFELSSKTRPMLYELLHIVQVPNRSASDTFESFLASRKCDIK